MTTNQMRFRVGLLALAGIGIAFALTFTFGSLPDLLQPTYTVTARFEDGSGLAPGVPVRQFGLEIGRVQDIAVDFQYGGVTATLGLRPDHPLREDAVPTVTRSLLGDAAVEFSTGRSAQPMAAGAVLAGETAADPMEVVAEVQGSAQKTLDSITATSDEWRLLAANANSLLATKEGSISEVVDRASVALTELTRAMRAGAQTLDGVNAVIGDPRMQEDLRKTVAGMPAMIQEAEQTVRAVRSAVGSVDATMRNLSVATEPLARNGGALTASIGRSLVALEKALGDLSTVSNMLSDENGSLGRLAGDPRLYESLNSAAGDLAAVMQVLEPTLRDVRIFADKIARHPELLGVRGALTGSDGLKDVPQASRAQSPR